MRRKLKGSVVTVVAAVLVVAVVFAAGVGVGMWLSRNDGGLSDEEVVQADVSVVETITETTIETTTDNTEEMTTINQGVEYITISVKGNAYFYNDKEILLDELIGKFVNDKTSMVKISYSNTATQFAYEELVKKLKENDIKYTEVD